MESLELFGTEVLPEFKARDAELRAKKAERLAPVVERAMARKVDTAPDLPDGYVMEALPKQLIKAFGGDDLLDRIAGDSSVGTTTTVDGLFSKQPD